MVWNQYGTCSTTLQEYLLIANCTLISISTLSYYEPTRKTREYNYKNKLKRYRDNLALSKLPGLLWESIVDQLVNELFGIYEARINIIFHSVAIWRHIVSI